MKPNPKISAAVAAILSAPATAIVFAARTANASPSARSEPLEEVIVTANLRTESMQNVPITVQALTARTLSQLTVSTVEEFVRSLPSVSTGSMGPGQATLFMRGL